MSFRVIKFIICFDILNGQNDTEEIFQIISDQLIFRFSDEISEIKKDLPCYKRRFWEFTNKWNKMAEWGYSREWNFSNRSTGMDSNSNFTEGKILTIGNGYLNVNDAL